jgi:predicted RNase H-like HicB family nuclease
MTMQYQVFVQSHPDKGYIATVLGVSDCVAEGDTKEEAVAKVRATLAERLTQGEVVTIEVDVPQPDHPWLKFWGVWKDDPTFDDFLAEIEAYRQELDAEDAQS